MEDNRTTSSIVQEHTCCRCLHWIGDRNDNVKVGICNYKDAKFKDPLDNKTKPLDFPTRRSFTCRTQQFEQIKTIEFFNGTFYYKKDL